MTYVAFASLTPFSVKYITCASVSNLTPNANLIDSPLSE